MIATLDETKLHEMVGKMVGDLGAAVTGALVITGDRLGLYKGLADLGPCTAEALAEHTGTAERYVTEWLANQSAAGYVTYDATAERFHMTPEQQAIFVDTESPVLMTGGFYAIGAVYRDEPKLTEAFRTGEGVSWSDHDGCLFCGTAKFFRPSYNTHLIAEWLPALEGVQQKLETGADVADVGCGFGLSTMMMAKAFPKSRFTGIDYHTPSVAQARKLAEEEGLTNVHFETAAAQNFGGHYDLVAMFDCLHDMGDPVGAAAQARKNLKPGGTLMLVEPQAKDRLEENLHPVGRVFYGFSTAICTPSGLSQAPGFALGAQAGPARLEAVTKEAGFSSFRKVAETPFSIVLEARG